jgi:hypothetical protein
MNMATNPMNCPMFAPIDEYERALGYLARLQARPAYKRTMAGGAPKL